MSYIALMPNIIGSDFPCFFLCVLTFILPNRDLGRAKFFSSCHYTAFIDEQDGA